LERVSRAVARIGRARFGRRCRCQPRHAVVTTPLRAAADAASVSSVTATASAIADAASAALCSAADATCRHPMASTATPLEAISNRHWCRLHRRHRHPGCHFHRCHHCQQSSCCSTRLEMEQPSSIRMSRMPALSPMLDRLLRAQTLCLLCGSSETIAAALVGLARGRSAGRGCGRRSLTCRACCCCSRSSMHLTEP
jgi:hypothetical protein